MGAFKRSPGCCSCGPTTPTPTGGGRACVIVQDGCASNAPLRGATVNLFEQYVSGANITDGGSGYQTPPTVTISKQQGRQAQATAVISNGAVVDLIITDGGNGYVQEAAISFSGGGGSGTPQSTVVRVDLDNATTNGPYTSTPAVTFSGGDGAGAQGTAVMSSGSSGSIDPTITVTAGGHGYTAPPSVSFGGGGTGAAATALMGLDAYTIVDPGAGGTPGDYLLEWYDDGGGTGGGMYTVGADGTLSGITIDPPGSYFQYSPTIDFYAANFFWGTPQVDFTFAVVAVTLNSGGSGYVNPTVGFSGGGGSGAAATATTAAVALRVDSIQLTAGGTYGVTPPDVTIDPPGGSGVQATGTAVLGAPTGGGGPTGAAATGVTATRGVGTPGTTHPMVVRVDVSNATTNGPYTSIPNVTFTGGDGAGAQGRAIMTGGSIDPAIAVTAGGHDYTAPPDVSFGGGGANAAATAKMGLDAYTIVDPGLGGVPGTYALEWLDDGGGGTGGGTYTIGADGTLSGITINPAGTNFTHPPTITFYASSLGGNPRVDFTLKVVSVSVVIPGSGYVNPTVQFTGGGGSGATATATASAARVGSVLVTDGGSYEATPPTVAIDPPGGAGVQATATAVLGTQACIGGLQDGMYLAAASAVGYTPSDPVAMATEITNGGTATGTVTLVNYYAWVYGCSNQPLPGATVTLSQGGTTIGTFTAGSQGLIGPVAMPTPYRIGTYTAVIAAPRFVTQTFAGTSLTPCTTSTFGPSPTWTLTGVVAGYHCFGTCPYPVATTLYTTDEIYGPVTLTWDVTNNEYRGSITVNYAGNQACPPVSGIQLRYFYPGNSLTIECNTGAPATPTEGCPTLADSGSHIVTGGGAAVTCLLPGFSATSGFHWVSSPTNLYPPGPDGTDRVYTFPITE
jgi:hypothetical protein